MDQFDVDDHEYYRRLGAILDVLEDKLDETANIAAVAIAHTEKGARGRPYSGQELPRISGLVNDAEELCQQFAERIDAILESIGRQR